MSFPFLFLENPAGSPRWLVVAVEFPCNDLTHTHLCSPLVSISLSSTSFPSFHWFTFIGRYSCKRCAFTELIHCSHMSSNHRISTQEFVFLYFRHITNLLITYLSSKVFNSKNYSESDLQKFRST